MNDVTRVLSTSFGVNLTDTGVQFLASFLERRPPNNGNNSAQNVAAEFLAVALPSVSLEADEHSRIVNIAHRLTAPPLLLEVVDIVDVSKAMAHRVEQKAIGFERNEVTEDGQQQQGGPKPQQEQQPPHQQEWSSDRAFGVILVTTGSVRFRIVSPYESMSKFFTSKLPQPKAQAGVRQQPFVITYGAKLVLRRTTAATSPLALRQRDIFVLEKGDELEIVAQGSNNNAAATNNGNGLALQHFAERKIRLLDRELRGRKFMANGTQQPAQHQQGGVQPPQQQLLQPPQDQQQQQQRPQVPQPTRFVPPAQQQQPAKQQMQVPVQQQQQQPPPQPIRQFQPPKPLRQHEEFQQPRVTNGVCFRGEDDFDDDDPFAVRPQVVQQQAPPQPQQRTVTRFNAPGVIAPPPPLVPQNSTAAAVDQNRIRQREDVMQSNNNYSNNLNNTTSNNLNINNIRRPPPPPPPPTDSFDFSALADIERKSVAAASAPVTKERLQQLQNQQFVHDSLQNQSFASDSMASEPVLIQQQIMFQQPGQQQQHVQQQTLVPASSRSFQPSAATTAATTSFLGGGEGRVLAEETQAIAGGSISPARSNLPQPQQQHQQTHGTAAAASNNNFVRPSLTTTIASTTTATGKSKNSSSSHAILAQNSVDPFAVKEEKQLQQKKQPPQQQQQYEVIDLLDSDDDQEQQHQEQQASKRRTSTTVTAADAAPPLTTGNLARHLQEKLPEHQHDTFGTTPSISPAPAAGGGCALQQQSSSRNSHQQPQRADVDSNNTNKPIQLSWTFANRRVIFAHLAGIAGPLLAIQPEQQLPASLLLNGCSSPSSSGKRSYELSMDLLLDTGRGEIIRVDAGDAWLTALLCRIEPDEQERALFLTCLVSYCHAANEAKKKQRQLQKQQQQHGGGATTTTPNQQQQPPQQPTVDPSLVAYLTKVQDAIASTGSCFFEIMDRIFADKTSGRVLRTVATVTGVAASAAEFARAK